MRLISLIIAGIFFCQNVLFSARCIADEEFIAGKSMLQPSSACLDPNFANAVREAGGRNIRPSGSADEPSGALKIMGYPLNKTVIKKLKKREEHWRGLAKHIRARMYYKMPAPKYGHTSEIGARVKVIYDETLPREVESWYFWEEDIIDPKILVVVMRSVQRPEIYDEIIFHELIESVWDEELTEKYLKSTQKKKNELTDNEITEIRRQAHILACLIQSQTFKSGEGLTSYHKRKLEELKSTPRILQNLVDEYFMIYNTNEGRDYHSRLIRGILGEDALRDLHEYESRFIKYARNMLSSENRNKIFAKLKLKQKNTPLRIFMEELGVEFDSRNREDALNSDSIPIIIRNIGLLQEHYPLTDKASIIAFLENSKYGPYAIRIQDAGRTIIIDITELAKVSLAGAVYGRLIKSMAALKKRYKHSVSVIKCKLEEVIKWGISLIAACFDQDIYIDDGTEKLIGIVERDINSRVDKQGLRFMDLGSESGIAGLAVTKLTDINAVLSGHTKTAVTNLKITRTINNLNEKIEVIESDLFSNLQGRRFDIITLDLRNMQHKNLQDVMTEDVFLNRLFNRFEEHLTRNGVMYIEISRGHNNIEKMMDKFRSENIIDYEEVNYEGRSGQETYRIFKVYPTRIKKLTHVSGPLKTIGAYIDFQLLQNMQMMEKRKLGWREEAEKKKEEQYSKEIKNIFGQAERIAVKVKFLKVSDLPQGVDAYYFWEESEGERKSMVVVVGDNYDEKIRDEIIYYGVKQSGWIERLTDEYLAEYSISNWDLTDEEWALIYYKAHLLAVNQQQLAFERKGETAAWYSADSKHTQIAKITLLHERKINNMDFDELSEVIREYNSGRNDYNSVLDAYYDRAFCYEARYYGKLIRNYAIRLALKRINNNNEGLLVAKHKSGDVKECYFDWSGVLSDLTVEERREIFEALRSKFGKGLKIIILSDGADSTLRDKMIGEGVSEVIDAAASSGLSYDGAISRTTKKDYLRNAVKDFGEKEAVLFFDNDAENFPAIDKVIRVGIIGRNSREDNIGGLIDTLGNPIGEPEYYLAHLGDIESVNTLLFLVAGRPAAISGYIGEGFSEKALINVKEKVKEHEQSYSSYKEYIDNELKTKIESIVEKEGLKRLLKGKYELTFFDGVIEKPDRYIIGWREDPEGSDKKGRIYIARNLILNGENSLVRNVIYHLLKTTLPRPLKGKAGLALHSFICSQWDDMVKKQHVIYGALHDVRKPATSISYIGGGTLVEYVPAVNNEQEEAILNKVRTIDANLAGKIVYSEKSTIAYLADLCGSFSDKMGEIIEVLEAYNTSAKYRDIEDMSGKIKTSLEILVEIQILLSSFLGWYEENIKNHGSDEYCIDPEELSLLQRAHEMSRFIPSLLKEALSGELSDEKEMVDMAFVLKEIIEKQNSKYNMQIEYNGFEGTSAMTEINSMHIKRIITNLLQNAYTALPEDRKKSCVIKISLEVDRDNNNFVIRFTDNAGGVKEDVLGNIFEFGVTSKTYEVGMHGIGLYMVREMVKLAGGDISVTNVDWEKGKGAEFKITLPLVEIADGGVITDAYFAEMTQEEINPQIKRILEDESEKDYLFITGESDEGKTGRLEVSREDRFLIYNLLYAMMVTDFSAVVLRGVNFSGHYGKHRKRIYIPVEILEATRGIDEFLRYQIMSDFIGHEVLHATGANEEVIYRTSERFEPGVYEKARKLYREYIAKKLVESVEGSENLKTKLGDILTRVQEGKKIELTETQLHRLLWLVDKSKENNLVSEMVELLNLILEPNYTGNIGQVITVLEEELLEKANSRQSTLLENCAKSVVDNIKEAEKEKLLTIHRTFTGDLRFSATKGRDLANGGEGPDLPDSVKEIVRYVDKYQIPEPANIEQMHYVLINEYRARRYKDEIKQIEDKWHVKFITEIPNGVDSKDIVVLIDPEDADMFSLTMKGVAMYLPLIYCEKSFILAAWLSINKPEDITKTPVFTFVLNFYKELLGVDIHMEEVKQWFSAPWLLRDKIIRMSENINLLRIALEQLDKSA
jgi:signal transduction histidine kinase/FMN phosphatase YigB (HAD superfamily)